LGLKKIGSFEMGLGMKVGSVFLKVVGGGKTGIVENLVPAGEVRVVELCERSRPKSVRD
jgi:hypothetical protein